MFEVFPNHGWTSAVAQLQEKLHFLGFTSMKQTFCRDYMTLLGNVWDDDGMSQSFSNLFANDREGPY